MATEEVEGEEEDEEHRIGTYIAMRSGDVLGPHTILKADHFPGLQVSSSAQ